MECSVTSCEQQHEYDFDEIILCQEHWEEFCSMTWWEQCRPEETTLAKFMESKDREAIIREEGG